MTYVTENRGQAEAELSAADKQVLRELTGRARAGGLRLTGEGGLLGKLTKMVIEGALEGELDDHLGYGKHDPEGRDGGNSRNGHRAKTVITETGPVELSVPRDRDSSFEPKIVGERADPRGNRRAPGRGLRRGGLQEDHYHDYRPGHGGPGGMAEPAPGCGVRGDLHRRDQREDPRGPGREPARLPRPGRHRRRGARRARPVGRGARRRGRRQVLAARLVGNQEPRGPGRVHAGLRRAERPA